MAQIPKESSDSKESDVACALYHFRTRSKQALFTCETEARTVLQRFNLFARGLQRGLTLLRSPLLWRVACRAMPRLSASLRAAFAASRGKANAAAGLSLSAGATRRVPRLRRLCLAPSTLVGASKNGAQSKRYCIVPQTSDPARLRLKSASRRETLGNLPTSQLTDHMPFGRHGPRAQADRAHCLDSVDLFRPKARPR